MIRVTGGIFRGRVLAAEVPNGVRPTSSRTREAVFSMIGQDLSGQSFLDLFGGAGVMAIEASSRGASPVVTVDRSPASVAAIRANVAAVGAGVDVVVADAARLGDKVGPANIVYLDPPFADDVGGWIVIAAQYARSALVAEARSGAKFPKFAGDLPLDRVRAYGESSVAIYRG
jgi:16S rRNA (guanine(966)-N(2))-methyltransferase RsmD